MEYTKNLNLKKPDVNEYKKKKKNNENMDLIDTAVGELNKNIGKIVKFKKRCIFTDGVVSIDISEYGFTSPPIIMAIISQTTDTAYYITSAEATTSQATIKCKSDEGISTFSIDVNIVMLGN